MRAYLPRILWLFALALAAAGAGWTALAAAGRATASGGRGPEAQVEASVNTVVKATYAVFQEMGITITETDFEEDDGEFDIEGMRGDSEVDVSIERVSPRFTEIEVDVDGDLFDGLDGDDEDEALARNILNRIVQRVS